MKSVKEICREAAKGHKMKTVTSKTTAEQKPVTLNPANLKPGDFGLIRGQEAVKRAATIAIVGNHPIVFIGPRGNGKTMFRDAIAQFKTIPVTRDGLVHVNCTTYEILPIKNLGGSLEGRVDDAIDALAHKTDIHVEVPSVPFRELFGRKVGTTSEQIKVQVDRSLPYIGKVSDELSDSVLTLLKQACDELGLSARSAVTVVRVAQTIAAMEGSSLINEAHIAEAVQYRLLDRKF